jgi:aspartyl-tRNA(Asn)/glutamyl-tRNA(Gln) amidotransferase subunit B
LSAYDAGVLVADKAIADYFESILEAAPGIEAKTVSNWVTGDLFGLLNAEKVDREAIDQTNISPENFAQLITLVEKGTINAQTAKKTVLPIMWETGKDGAQIVEDEGLAQISDENLISETVQAALDENPDMVQKYLDGNEKVMNALFGKTMGKLRGKGDPGVVRQVLQEKLDTLKT